MQDLSRRVSRALIAAVLLLSAVEPGLGRGTGIEIAAAPDVLVQDLVALPPIKRPVRAPTEAEVLESYADIALAGYEDALTTARVLDAAIDALIARPDVTSLGWARITWKLARIPYLQTEVFRFGNPIVDRWEAGVNGWPLNEALVDYVGGAVGPSIIASGDLTIGGIALDATDITPAWLREQLQPALGEQGAVATGYHAIEFLLWGEDLNGDGPGTGMRPPTDYSTAEHAERRGAYLKAVSALLVSDLEDMVANWQADGAARAALSDLGLSAILTGMASLGYGELAGDRMQLGLLTHDPDAERDRYSDYTHIGYLMNGVGIRSVYQGRYLRTDGTLLEGASLSAHLAAKNPALDVELTALIIEAISRLTAINNRVEQGQSYDEQIRQGNEAGNAVVQAAIDALIAQTRGIERAAAVLELDHAISVKNSEALRQSGTVVQ